MAIRKRKWTYRDKDGRITEGEAFVVFYTDQGGRRRQKTFETQKAAKDWAASTHIEVKDGTHVADSGSITIIQAGDLWIKTAEGADLERATLEQYKQHLNLHIVPFLGRTKLSRLTAPGIRAFADKLREEGRSATMVKYILRSLGGLISDAQERGLIVRNPVYELRRKRQSKGESKDRRGKKLKVGVDIPTPDEIKRIVAAASGKWRPLLLTAIFSGLRSSELRGLRWQDIDFKKAELHVRQRADKFREIGPPKSEAGERALPLPPIVVATLREWRLACPNGELGLCFPNGKGNPEFHNNVIHRGLWPAMIAAGVVVVDKDTGDVSPKYTGLHALRHFYASWLINRKADGGLELPAKVVQYRMGHSSIVVTMDTYGHLFPRGDDAKEMADAEAALLGPGT
jgi:integrase